VLSVFAVVCDQAGGPHCGDLLEAPLEVGGAQRAGDRLVVDHSAFSFGKVI
jgi:hypothetical protein